MKHRDPILAGLTSCGKGRRGAAGSWSQAEQETRTAGDAHRGEAPREVQSQVAGARLCRVKRERLKDTGTEVSCGGNRRCRGPEAGGRPAQELGGSPGENGLAPRREDPRRGRVA